MTMRLSREILSAIAPPPDGIRRPVRRAIWDGYMGVLTGREGMQLLREAGILESRQRLAHFLAQIMHESGRLTIREENLRYTSVRAVRGAWPSRAAKHSVEWIKAHLLREPKALGEWAYGGRMGNNEPGDGYRYRGRGLIQTTGKDAYRALGEKLDLPLVEKPELLGRPINALKAALWEWGEIGGNALADEDNIAGISRAINRGNARSPYPANGEADRIALYKRARTVLVQARLRELGYPVGAVDGVAGHQTEMAVIEFQKTAGLATDGKVGPATLEALESDDAPPKPVSEQRAEAKPADLAKAGSKTVKAAEGAEVGGAVATGAGALAVLKGMSETISAWRPHIETVQSAVQYLGQHLGFVALVVGGAALWWWARRIKWRRVLDHRLGLHLGR